ncbi:MAG: HAD family phosphatase [Bacillaceae bacterium]|nr:HAD family phosphatase [Bacillaceae bacterium]
MNQIKSSCIVSDMDGTLLNRDKQISAGNLRAIRQFVRTGGTFTVATGRMAKTVRPYAEELELKCPVILYNGAQIFDFTQNRVLWEKRLPAQAITLIKEMAARFPDISLFMYEGDHILVFQNHAYIREVEQSKKLPLRRIGHADDITGINLFKIVLYHVDVNRLREAELLLKQNTAYQIVYSHPHYLEVLPEGVSKGSALRVWSEWTGIPQAQVLAVGDNMNDEALLKEAGIGVAVSNAHPDLKKIADHITVSHDEDAVKVLIENWMREWR